MWNPKTEMLGSQVNNKKNVRSVRRNIPKLVFHLWDPNDSVFEIQIHIAYSSYQKVPVGEKMEPNFEDLA